MLLITVGTPYRTVDTEIFTSRRFFIHMAIQQKQLEFPTLILLMGAVAKLFIESHYIQEKVKSYPIFNEISCLFRVV